MAWQHCFIPGHMLMLIAANFFSLTCMVTAEEKLISGVSGKRFSGAPVREVTSDQLNFAGMRRSDLRGVQENQKCEKWIVVTTIFQPSVATRMLGQMTRLGWCYVVVADKNGPSEYDDVEGVTYLTVEKQRALHFQIMNHIPWRHFGRKNVGYLWAIAHGAKIIYDTDDDNRIKELKIPIMGENFIDEDKKGNFTVLQPHSPFETSVKSYNPYPDFRPSCGHIWPRGYPLDRVTEENTSSLRKTFLERPPAIQQFLADEDPDVDAIFRLTRPLPCNFEGLPPGGPDTMVLPVGKFAPYNAQATVHLYESFWGILLPVTVHGRVSDIWRAYITQKLLWDLGQHLSFRPAYVVHDRVAHDYLKDFQSEGDLYLKTAAMLNFLSEWKSDAPTLVERIEQLWVEFYRRDFVGEGDLLLAQAWIKDLISIGYKFPELKIMKIMWVDKKAQAAAEKPAASKREL